MSKATPSAYETKLPQDGHHLVPVGCVEDRHLCASCKNILQKPYQLNCGHHACYLCLGDIFINGEPAKCPKSTEDDPCDDLFKKDTFLDVHVAKEIDSQQVHCPNNRHGCPVVDARKDILKHEENCEYQIVQCQYGGCDEQITKISFDKHVSNCQFMPIQCRKCQQEIPKNKLEVHEDYDCPEIMVDCPYRCSSTLMKRRYLKEHLSTCSLKPKKCNFDIAGCEFSGTETEIEIHLKEAVVQHALLLANQNREKQHVQFNAFKEMMETIRRKIDTSAEDLGHLTTKMYTLAENVTNLERVITEQPTRENLEEHSRDITTLKERVQTLFSQMRDLRNTGGTITQFGSLNEMSERLSGRLNVHERQINWQGDKLAEMELKHQILESANYDGTIVWKIGDYRRRKQDAVDGRTISLYSQPFFTGRFGYKMCLRAYLNGDGPGRGSYLSIFISILKGEFDALLAWPFQQEVKIFLLDQSPGRIKRPLMDKFFPDPFGASFQRPTTEMNVASGRPMFVSHSDLENPSKNYIVDDVLFIRCLVSTSGLSN